MKKNAKIILPVLFIILIAACILIYARALPLSKICGISELEKMQAFDIIYEIHPDDEPVQYSITRDDPQFQQIFDLVVKRNYSRSLWSLFPQTTKTHSLQGGDFRWYIGCIFDETQTKNGELVSGSLLGITNFYGKLYIDSLGSTWICSTNNQKQFISECMNIIVK